jgi:hypothetical protein
MPDVRMPDGTIIRNVPEGTTRAQLQSRVQKAQPDNRPTSFLRGIAEGAMKPWNNAARLLEAGADAIGVDDAISGIGKALGMAPTVAAAEKVQGAKSARAPTRASGVGRAVGEIAGTLPTLALPGGAFAQGAYSSGLLTNQRDPKNIAAEMLVGGVVGKAGDVALRGVTSRIADRKIAKAVPTVEQLKGQASRLYQKAEQRGITATKKQTQTLASKMKAVAQDEGLISPTGRVSSAYPKAKEALDLTKDFARGQMTPKQMQTVRKVLSEGAGSTDRSERRIAMAMLDNFDDWTAPLAPELAQARSVSRRYINAEKLGTARELAESKAGQFTGSGLENALRTEYRNLDRQIVRGQERGFTPETIEAINKVSRGTTTSNIARNVGKLAPTGVVSGGLATGVPFLVGNAIGGPTLGGILAAGAGGAGLAGRRLATDINMRNAGLAELIARQGGALPQAPQLPPEVARALAAILAGGSQQTAQASTE